jgi:hypothetical protein
LHVCNSSACFSHFFSLQSSLSYFLLLFNRTSQSDLQFTNLLCRSIILWSIMLSIFIFSISAWNYFILLIFPLYLFMHFHLCDVCS